MTEPVGYEDPDYAPDISDDNHPDNPLLMALDPPAYDAPVAEFEDEWRDDV